ncbi:hypothetical protein L218DRAFT_574884 [Marasmius fiardii PR-910]|nr:hypothetical protein L218DRAFT_574884 [Marasmius fiardii PR-910]
MNCHQNFGRLGASHLSANANLNELSFLLLFTTTTDINEPSDGKERHTRIHKDVRPLQSGELDLVNYASGQAAPLFIRFSKILSKANLQSFTSCAKRKRSTMKTRIGRGRPEKSCPIITLWTLVRFLPPRQLSEDLNSEPIRQSIKPSHSLFIAIAKDDR